MRDKQSCPRWPNKRTDTKFRCARYMYCIMLENICVKFDKNPSMDDMEQTQYWGRQMERMTPLYPSPKILL